MSMSSNELIPLFPSATHPALPISSQILSTLRHLTAPGKGNDLKPEERAALVGVAALLGCERIQSKDLPLASAQKASSVSPAHFRSTLTRCRKLLEDVSTKSPTTSPSKRSPRKQPASTSTSASSTGLGEISTSIATGIGGAGVESSSQVVTTQDVINPLATPKKKYKFSSGIDISSLVKTARTPQTPRISHAHEPSTASPLRHSVVRQPSAKHPHPNKIDVNASAADGLEDLYAIDEDEEGDELRLGPDGIQVDVGTPTKIVKYSNPVGIDLENPPARFPRTGTAKKKREDASAFFALRPGAVASPAHTNTKPGEGEGGREADDIDEAGWMHRRPQETHTHRTTPRQRQRARDDDEQDRSERRKKRKQKREEDKKRNGVDWTFSESVWGSKSDEEVNRYMNRIWSELPTWLEEHGRPSIDHTRVKGTDVVDIILNAFKHSHSSGLPRPQQQQRRGSDEVMDID
ncbi:hypothetical protein I316_07934 [Kwoniella heveanensis BCC8398]|uniref:Uncharacterized protein n=1 Tax=Kwoniella heveanensis BCC8398 TaxID=1296120 RepID=A0A1B9GHK3_9TREE|nr:hypothetical protein I316_07934 [Kwoniella heveanensis BCC8398]